ncbi:hypothetical protein, partial [Lunatibacter salilacus]|uniref:hypothetical protein n=1 Tax=Lunatibacter salilacus TaxID=2483804 RepID=UPI001F4421D8
MSISPCLSRQNPLLVGLPSFSRSDEVFRKRKGRTGQNQVLAGEEWHHTHPRCQNETELISSLSWGSAALYPRLLRLHPYRAGNYHNQKNPHKSRKT